MIAQPEPRRGQVWRPYSKARRNRRITVTAVHPGYVIGLSSPATGRGLTVRVRIPTRRMGGYQLIEEAPSAPPATSRDFPVMSQKGSTR